MSEQSLKINTEYYDKLYSSGGYGHDDTEDTFQRFYWERQKYVAALFNNYIKGKVLDIGCGEGELSRFIVSDELHLADISGVALKKASKFADSATVCNMYKLPFGDESFDSVICTEVIYHIENPELAFQEIKRVLKPGGRFLFSAGLGNSLAIRAREIADRLSGKKKQNDEVFFTFYSRRELLKFFRNTSFHLNYVEPFLFEYPPVLKKSFSMRTYQRLIKAGRFVPLFARYLFVIGEKVI